MQLRTYFPRVCVRFGIVVWGGGLVISMIYGNRVPADGVSGCCMYVVAWVVETLSCGPLHITLYLS